MKFPMLQMLAEGKKKKAAMDDMDADMDMDMDMDTSMEPEGGKSAGDKKGAPKGMKAKGDEPVVDKAAVLKFLKGCDAACRKSVAGKLDAMVAADEEAAAKKK
jgi:hypothetical protein